MAHGMHLAGKTILITGAGSGIGRLLALSAAQRGAQVIIWDRADSGQDVCDELRAADHLAHFYRVDITNSDAVAAAAVRVLEDVGPVDILVNNAGVVSGRPLLELDAQAVRTTFEVNTLALFWTTQAFLPAMIAQQRGLVVTVASAAGMVGVARQTDYSASKFAAVGFTEALRSELRAAKTGVQTLTVCPYYIHTGMFDGVKSRFPLLLPIMEPQPVVDRILRAIETGKKQLVLPPAVHMVKLARLLPISATDKILDILGLNKGMDAFTGRPGDRIENHSAVSSIHSAVTPNHSAVSINHHGSPQAEVPHD